MYALLLCHKLQNFKKDQEPGQWIFTYTHVPDVKWLAGSYTVHQWQCKLHLSMQLEYPSVYMYMCVCRLTNQRLQVVECPQM